MRPAHIRPYALKGKRNTSLSGGFTLIEMAVVLVIVAISSAMLAYYGLGMFEQSQQSQTRTKLDRIEEALEAYRNAYGRLPCPSDQGVAAGAATYGVTADNPGRCTGGSPAATYSATNAVEGGVPFKTLELPEQFATDGWGRKFTYAVDPRMTEPGAFENYDIHDRCGGITINDAAGSARSTIGIYALISYGEDGHGAFMPSGARFSAGGINPDQLANCNCSSAGAYDGAYAPVYVQKDMVTSTDAAYFDDLVRFKERWQMQTEGDTLAKAYEGPEIAFVYDDSPYVSFYTKSCDSYTLQASPASLPAGTAKSVSASPDNNYWAVAHATSPYVTIYKRNASTGALTKLANPSTLPAGDAFAVAFSRLGDYLAVGHDDGAPVSNYLSIYKINTDTDAFTYLTGGAGGPTLQPGDIVSSVSFSPQDLYLAAANAAAPYYLRIYRRSGDVFTNVDLSSKMDTPPTGLATGVAFSPDGRYLAVSHGSAPYLSVYAITAASDTFTRLASPATLPPSDTASVSYSRDSTYLAVALSGGTNSVYIYSVDPATGALTLVASTGTSYGNALSVAFSPRQNVIGVGAGFPTYASVIKYLPGEHYFDLRAAGTLSQPAGAANGVAMRYIQTR